jgi:hypothetical protein
MPDKHERRGTLLVALDKLVDAHMLDEFRATGDTLSLARYLCVQRIQSYLQSLYRLSRYLRETSMK